MNRQRSSGFPLRNCILDSTSTSDWATLKPQPGAGALRFAKRFSREGRRSLGGPFHLGTRAYVFSSSSLRSPVIGTDSHHRDRPLIPIDASSLSHRLPHVPQAARARPHQAYLTTQQTNNLVQPSVGHITLQETGKPLCQRIAPAWWTSHKARSASLSLAKSHATASGR